MSNVAGNVMGAVGLGVTVGMSCMAMRMVHDTMIHTQNQTRRRSSYGSARGRSRRPAAARKR